MRWISALGSVLVPRTRRAEVRVRLWGGMCDETHDYGGDTPSPSPRPRHGSGKRTPCRVARSKQVSWTSTLVSGALSLGRGLHGDAQEARSRASRATHPRVTPVARTRPRSKNQTLDEANGKAPPV